MTPRDDGRARSRLSMAHILLVAHRELRQTLRTRSFWLTLVLFPLVPILGGVIGSAMSTHGLHEQVLVADPSNRVFAPLRDSLSAIAPTIDVIRAGPGPTAEVLKADDGAGGAALDRVVRPLVTAAKDQSGANAPHYDYVIVVPPDFPGNTHVAVWAAHAPGETVVPALRKALADAMRDAAMRTDGISDHELARLRALAPDLAITAPSRLFDEAAITRATPAALAYLLILVLVISAQWLLQALVEERSGRLLEALLACVSPEELLCGKLVGALEAATILLTGWAVAAILGAGYLAPKLGMSLGDILAPLMSLRVLLGVPFFMIVGYGLLAMIFLAIASLCETMREAQGMLSPLILLLIVPTQIFLQFQGSGYTSPLLDLAHWVPIWTPFLALASIRTTPLWALVGQGIVLSGFCGVVFFFLMRIFRHSLLRTGQRPGWRDILASARREM